MLNLDQRVRSNVAEVASSDEGQAVFEASPQLQEIVNGFVDANDYSEHLSGGVAYVGSGDNSIVYHLDGVALKVSTPITPKFAHHGKPGTPENLVRQFRFMSQLHHYLDQSDGQVIAPQQYFAIGTKSGSYLSAFQYLDGWQSLQSWLKNRSLSQETEAQFAHDVRMRILRGVGNKALRMGLGDLHIRSTRLFKKDNVLVESATESPLDSRICIIDQPTRGVLGKIATAVCAL